MRKIVPVPSLGRVGVIALISCGLALPAIAAPAPAANVRQRIVGGEAFPVRTVDGHRTFQVQTPDARSSPAEPTDAAWANVLLNVAIPAPGYELHARVVVRSGDGAAVRALVQAAEPLANVTPADPDGRVLEGFWYVDAPSVRAASRLADTLSADAGVLDAVVDARRPRVDRILPTDPNVPQQWYISNAANPIADLNVEPAWTAGWTGAGVTVGLLEGGWDVTHPDLAPNYHAAASQADRGFSAHGTSTAGLVGMVANNNMFGAGVSYGGKIARLYYGTDTETADGFLYRNELNAIKTNSWGPPDSGWISTISPVEAAAIRDSALTGRGGLGTVFVWAAGNGQASSDRVEYDPYASNRYVIAVGAIDNQDRQASYSEPGSSLMLVAPSSFDFAGSGGSGVYTTTIGNSGTSAFGGTSSTSPMAAGVVALMLQARPDLSYRDVQHVLIRSARRCAPSDPGWDINAGGLWFNEKFGFGAIDAAAAVSLAQTWMPRPAAIDYALPQTLVGAVIPDSDSSGVSSNISVKANLRVERALVTLTAPHAALGNLRVELIAPSGTRSLLAETRSDFSFGYTGYVFATVRHWDEDANGVWTLRVSDQQAGTVGVFDAWQLTLVATPRPCPADWNRTNSVTVQDVFDFLTDWFSGTADVNNDQSTSIQDVFDFLSAFFASAPGC